MKPQFINKIVSSFVCFLDHEILSRGDAYTNVSGALSAVTGDPNYNSKHIYASPYRQFVYDSSIVGASVPSGVYVSGSFVARGTSGLSIDYDMGRVMSNAAISQPVTCAYAYKDFNIYYAEDQDEALLFEAKYPVSPKDTRGNVAAAPLDWNTLTYPAIFIKNNYNENTPFAFGGLDETQVDFRCIFIADTPYLLDGGLSICADSARRPFPVLLPRDTPFNAYGDYKKANGFNYVDVCNQYLATGSYIALVDGVKISKFAPNVNRMIGNNSYGGFADFTIKFIRNPRQ